MSDINLTENCGLLNKLLPGDTVLADRGFDMKLYQHAPEERSNLVG